ncbi:MAG: RDD family protein [Nitrosopumilaceae archaeon]
MSDPNYDVSTELVIAKWSDRFIAWLIDFLIISSVSTMIFAVTYGTYNLEWSEAMIFSEATNYLPTSIVFFGYWIILEYKTGQSIGKKIIHLKIVDLEGKSPLITGVVISSFGKSFLLPLDMILGLIFTNQKRQRIFNKISDTIIIKIKNTETNNEKINYKKD